MRIRHALTAAVAATLVVTSTAFGDPAATRPASGETKSAALASDPVASVYGVTQATRSSGPLTLARPAGVAAGDLLLIFLAQRSSDEQAPPAGFTLKRMAEVNGHRLYAFTKIAGTSEAPTVSFNFASGSTSAVAVYYVIEHADQSSPFEDDQAAVQYWGPLPIPSVTVTSAPTLQLGVVSQFSSGYSPISFTPPSGWSEDADVFDNYYSSGTGNATALLAASVVRSTSGPTGEATATSTPSAGYFASMSFSIRSAASHAPAARYLPSIVASGTPGIGQTLTATDAVWSESPSGTTSWQWQRDSGGNGEFSDISGATSASYQLTAADGGHRVRVKATRTNSAGSGVAYSWSRNTSSNPASIRSLTQATGLGQLTLNRPAGVQSGDLLLIFLAQYSTRDQTPTAAAAGFSLARLVESGVSGYHTYAFYKIAGASEAATITFNQASGSTPAAAVYLAVKHADRSNPFEDVQDATAAWNPRTLPSLTTESAPTLQLGVVSRFRQDYYPPVSFTPPAGWSEDADLFAYYYSMGSGYSVTLGVSHLQREIAGAIPSADAFSSNNYGSSAQITLAIRPALAQPPEAFQQPSISGLAEVGRELTAAPGQWNNGTTSLTFQWQRCSSSGPNCVDIVGANGTTYTVQAADVGSRLRVVVVATNSSGSASAASNVTAVGTGAPVLVEPSSIPTDAPYEDEPFTATPATFAPDPTLTVTYQWQRCWGLNPEPDDCADITREGGTSTSYTPFVGDLDYRLRFKAIASNATGTVESISELSQTVRTVKPYACEKPSIRGVTSVGETLTADEGHWHPCGDPLPWTQHPPDELDYQWGSCDLNGENCVDFEGETGSFGDEIEDTYEPSQLDQGRRIRLKVTAENDYGTRVEIVLSAPVHQPVQELAFTYRPHLLFHGDEIAESGSHELWRPLNIENFLTETGWGAEGTRHRVCLRGQGCLAPTTPDLDLDEHDSEDAYIDINGIQASEYRRLDGDCAEAGPLPSDLLDCDAGSRSAIYYTVGQDRAGYLYIDYWWFLRYNEQSALFGAADNYHEGDWEGVTVMLDVSGATPLPYAFRYAAHNSLNWFHASQVFGSGGTHPYVFSARGGHASYPYQCPTAQDPDAECYQPPNSDWPYEAPHDGTAAWGNNDDQDCAANCVIRFPEPTDASPWVWTNWLGRWGSSLGPGPLSDSPPSPGRQDRYDCAVAAYDSFGCERAPGSRGISSLSALNTGGPRFCASWFGFGVAVLACDQAQLQRAIARHQLRRKGALQIKAGSRRSASAPGLAQVIGEPLRPGETVTFIGRASPRTMLYFDIAEGRRRVRLSVRFTELGDARRIRVVREKDGFFLRAGDRRLKTTVEASR